MNAAPPVNRMPCRASSPIMLNKIKPFLITALVAIVAVALFNRFAPDSIKKLLYGAPPATTN